MTDIACWVGSNTLHASPEPNDLNTGVTARSATTVFRGRHIIRWSPNLVDHTRRIRRPNEIGGASNFGGHTFQTVTYFGVFTHRILRPTENRDHRIWQPSRVSGGHIFRCVQPPKCVTHRNSRPPNSATVYGFLVTDRGVLTHRNV